MRHVENKQTTVVLQPKPEPIAKVNGYSHESPAEIAQTTIPVSATPQTHLTGILYESHFPFSSVVELMAANSKGTHALLRKGETYWAVEKTPEGIWQEQKIENTQAKKLLQNQEGMMKGITFFSEIRRQPPVDKYPNTKLIEKLTPRQIEILENLAYGKSSGEIAQELTIAEDTLKGHIREMISRLGLKLDEEGRSNPKDFPRINLIVYAIANGIIPIPDFEKMPKRNPDKFSRISPRKMEILELLDQEKSSRDIAELLTITTSSVQNDVRDIMRTLGVSNRQEALEQYRHWKQEKHTKVSDTD